MEPSQSSPSTWRSILVGVLVLSIAVFVLIALRGLPQPKERAERPAPAVPAEVKPAENLGELAYANHCASCHGDKGEGDGPAVRFIYPKPRNFSEGKFRVVSTLNRRPSDDDLLQVIDNGMPGSAMFPFRHLAEAERRALAAHVRTLIAAGSAERFRRNAREQGETIDEEELVRNVERATKPGDLLPVPADVALSTPASVAHGHELYKKTCAACHGETGKGDGPQEQLNDDGTPNRPRDFGRGIFKGGSEPAHIYARIMLGMPGSPMPASQGNQSPEEVRDMVHFIGSLADKAAQAKHEHKRAVVTARRTGERFKEVIADSQWSAAPLQAIVVTPLWWRDYQEPELQVQALHDGTEIAIRLSWNDRTRNDTVSLPEEFEDLAAIQLCKSQVEPFLGMGAKNGQVDLWLWRASWQKPADDSRSILDDYPFELPFYRDRTRGQEKTNPDFLTARAAGNQHSHADPKLSASSLHARGPGSVTFLPRASQAVAARSDWKSSKWTVVFRRPLSVGAEDGIGLAAPGSCSVAFAIWDGAARDRNGQKLVSIWHDFKLE